MNKKENVTHPLCVKIHPTLFHKLEELSKMKYKTVSEIVRDLIAKFVEENDKKDNNG